MARVHIIENNKDIDIAKRFEIKLRDHHAVSADINFLVPGQEWRTRLREAVLAADGLIAIFTENSVQQHSNIISSQWMAADIGAARALGKFVIPVLIGTSVRVPALVDDIWTVRANSSDETALDEAIMQVNRAVTVLTSEQAKKSALGLPPGHEHLGSAVLSFHEDGSFDKSVFIMMKFADHHYMTDVQCRLLKDIFEVIDKHLNLYGLIARRADKRIYRPDLWENICVYMLGSRYGIAILEDRVANEMNPNVALEYGFMMSLNRRVALFRDREFKHDRADLTGKLSQPFQIDSGGGLQTESLAEAVKGWLVDLGLPQVRRA